MKSPGVSLKFGRSVKAVEAAERLIGREWWYFYCGMLTAIDIQLICGIYILPKILRVLEVEGVI